jgi:hypothetical protein
MVKGYSTMAQARVNSSRWLSGLAVGLVVSSYAYGGTSYVAPNGFVPDAATAIRVAEAILLPIYGEEKVLSERPFRASLGAGVWTIQGRYRRDGRLAEWLSSKLQSAMPESFR